MNDAECADWCVRALRRMGKRISGENAARMVFTVGRDAALLRQEMDLSLIHISTPTGTARAS